MYGRDRYLNFPKYSYSNYEPPRSYSEAANSLRKKQMRYRWEVKDAKVIILFNLLTPC